MSSDTSKAKTGTNETEPVLPLPPEERFWKRYSPHHEFTLSSASSALVHILALGILALGAHTFASWATPVEVDAIEIGGGGRQDGVDGFPSGKFAHIEDVKDMGDSAPLTRTPPRTENLKDAEKLKNSLVKPADEPRLTDAETALASKNLSVLGQQVRDRLNGLQQRAASKGIRGPGQKGGEGPGTGPAKGPGFGPGGTIRKRQERQGRWTMNFNIRDPEDYARQLSALGAYLAVPAAREDEYLVIEDLSRRPAVAKPRNVSEINRMFWFNEDPDAVAPLFRVLRYEKTPSYFLAYFPPELQRELLQKELEYGHLPEDKIQETKFQIRRTSGGRGYEPVVISQEVKP